MDWMSPLITSGLRLVVISLLFVGNCVAACRLCISKKYKGASCCKWMSIFTILILNLTYLSTIWTPFTITTFKYNLQDLQQSNSKEVLENGGGETKNFPINDEKIEDLQSQTNVGFHNNRYSRSEKDLLTRVGRHSRLSESLDHYITAVQDLITSSYTYTLLLLIFVTKIPSYIFVPMGRLALSLFSLVYIVIPIILSTADRMISGTTNHRFTLHYSETPVNGYMMFSIICDVNITLKYVVGVFRESTMILLLTLMLLVVKREKVKRMEASAQKKEQRRNESQCIEDVAYKFVLLLGSTWAWPVKPVLVAMLFYFNGEHWNNGVCWLANMVVAVPVVFMPFTVLISRYEKPDNDAGYDVFSDSAKDNQVVKEKAGPMVEVRKETKDDACLRIMESVKTSKVENLTNADKNSANNRSQARENLEFYLGTDIFRSKKEDEVCILSKQSIA